MKVKSGFFTALLILVLVLIPTFGACSQTSAVGPAPATIKIGAAIAITGGQAGGGAQIKAGYECAVEAINKAGGVYVKAYDKKIPLELVVLDDQSDPTKTVSQLEVLYSQDVVAYLGSMSSALNVAGCAIGEKNKVPWLGISFACMAPHKQGYKYVFSPFAKSPDFINIFECIKDLPDKPTKAALFMRKEDWGTEMLDVFTQAATKYGFTIVYNQDYAPGTTDFSSMIMAAKAAGADMLLGIPIAPEGIAMMKQMKQLDWAPKWVCLIRGPDGATWGNTAECDYVCCMPDWHSNCDWPGVDDINTWYQAKFERPADVLVGPAYACVQILANAIERAGTLDRNAIRDAIASTNMPTVVGQMSFRTDGTGVIETIVVCQWQNGKIQCIWPAQHASAKLVYPFPAWSGR
jgi:branched-chain amino acid transport system substrate-binding protein